MKIYFDGTEVDTQDDIEIQMSGKTGEDIRLKVSKDGISILANKEAIYAWIKIEK